MGLSIHTLRLLLHAQKQGAELDSVVTIGRLDVLLTPQQLEDEFAAFGVPFRKGEAEELIHARDRYCEPIIERLGAKKVDALDASDYEGANIIHDLNAPLAPEHMNRYSLLLDGGTLEHVFHFPEALKSCMSMVKVGGHALFSLPANNEMGHGFYQFSPDLFFRAFSEENGYRLKGLYLAPLYRDGEWLKVQDPADVKQRVGYNTSIDELACWSLPKKFVMFPCSQIRRSNPTTSLLGKVRTAIDWNFLTVKRPLPRECGPLSSGSFPNPCCASGGFSWPGNMLRLPPTGANLCSSILERLPEGSRVHEHPS